jgi:hypothetical protein
MVHEVLDQRKIGDSSAQITEFLSARSGELKASQQDKPVESSKGFFHMPDHRESA